MNLYRRSPVTLFLACGFSALLFAGCGGAGGTESEQDDAGTLAPDAGAPSDAGTNLGWGSNTSIQSILEANCSRCHSSQWSNCWTVQESAQEMESAVSSGFMPRGGAMAAADKNALVAWLSAGAECSGTEPDGGGVEGPILAGEIVTNPRP